tara:strand:+ start:40 stop:528 length:489 start_codon:yes stop_codon:yes gene_type:complete
MNFKNLLLLEKAILDSLNDCPKTVGEIHEDIGVEHCYVVNALNLMLREKWIKFFDMKYLINCEEGSQGLKSNNFRLPNYSNEEIEVISNMKNLNLVKVSLSKFEEKILKVHLKNIEDFFNNLDNAVLKTESKRRETSLCREMFFVWGSSNFGDVLRSSLQTK